MGYKSDVRIVTSKQGYKELLKYVDMYYKDSRKEACDIFDNLTKSKIIDKIVQYEIEIP